VRLVSAERGESGAPRDATADDLGSAPTVASEEGGVEIIDRVAEEWRRLCEEGPNDEPFYRPEWIRAYVRAFEPAKRFVLVTARVGGRLQAVLPLIQERALSYGFPVTRLRGAANCHSCRFDVVRGAGLEGDAAVSAIWKSLKHLRQWDVLQLCDVPETGALDRLCDVTRGDGLLITRWESKRSPYIPLSAFRGDEDPWRSNSSANFRSSMRKRIRRLGARGPLRLRRIETADPHFIQQFYDFEKMGWKGDVGSAIACNQSTRTFYDEIAENAARFNYLSLYFLEVNDQMVAANFGLSYRGRFFSLKLVMNEEYREFGPGHLMINAGVQDCVERGFTHYDFTGPREEYESTWTSHVRPHSEVLVFRDGPYGRLLRAVNVRLRGHFRFRARVRALLGRTDHSPRSGGQPA